MLDRSDRPLSKWDKCMAVWDRERISTVKPDPAISAHGLGPASSTTKRTLTSPSSIVSCDPPPAPTSSSTSTPSWLEPTYLGWFFGVFHKKKWHAVGLPGPPAPYEAGANTVYRMLTSSALFLVINAVCVMAVCLTPSTLHSLSWFRYGALGTEYSS